MIEPGLGGEMRIIVGLLALMFLGVLGGRGEADACVCGIPAEPPCRLTAGDVVFVGTVIDVTDVPPDRVENSGNRKFVFQVQEAFAGVKGRRVEVFSSTSSCGTNFAPGETYLVQAGEGDDGRIGTGACTFTRRASDAPQEIQILRKINAREPYVGIFGRLIEFRKPNPMSRPTDADLWQPLPGVAVVVSSAVLKRRTTTDAEGHFSFATLPPGVYRIKVALEPPLKLSSYPPGFRGFHQRSENPERIELRDCPVRVALQAMGWGQ
jgi:hypothetical protein